MTIVRKCSERSLLAEKLSPPWMTYIGRQKKSKDSLKSETEGRKKGGGGGVGRRMQVGPWGGVA